MSSRLDSSIETVTLDAGVTPDDPVEIDVPRGGEFEVRSVSGNAWMRFNNRQQERRPLRPGETVCWRADDVPITRILLDNGDGEEATVEYEVRYGFTVRGFGGRPQGSAGQPPGPRRLRGELAPGSTIADGEGASETVDVSLAEQVRVRAKVSGMADLVLDGTVGLDPETEQVHAVEVDRDAGVLVALYRAPAGNIGIATFGLSDPSNPVLQDSVTFADGAIGARNGRISHGLALDTGDSLALALLNQDTHGPEIVQVDYSDPTALVVDGFTDHPGGDVGSTGEGRIRVDPDTDVVVTTIASVGRLHLFSYTSGAAPTLEDSHLSSTAANQWMEMADELGRIYFARSDGSGNERIDVLEWTSEDLVFLATNIYDADLINGGVLVARYDPDLDLLISQGNAPGNRMLVAWDLREPLNPVVAWTALDDAWNAIGKDPTRSVVYISEADGVNDVISAVTYDRSGAQVEASTGAVGDAAEDFAVLPSADALYTAQLQQNEIQVVQADPGSARLQVRELLSDGTPSPNGGGVTTLQAGAEEMLDVDTLGPDEVEIDVENQGPGQATVDHVEIAQE